MSYLALIARRIYGNPDISLAGLNIILHKRMEACNGLFDDKTKVRAFSPAEMESALEPPEQGQPQCCSQPVRWVSDWAYDGKWGDQNNWVLASLPSFLPPSLPSFLLFFFFFFFFFCLSRSTLQLMEVPRLGVELELHHSHSHPIEWGQRSNPYPHGS